MAVTCASLSHWLTGWPCSAAAPEKCLAFAQDRSQDYQEPSSICACAADSSRSSSIHLLVLLLSGASTIFAAAPAALESITTSPCNLECQNSSPAASLRPVGRRPAAQSPGLRGRGDPRVLTLGR